MYYDVLPKQVTVSVNFLIPISEITSVSRRRASRITMTQFPINTANARTCHKLQGRTIRNLFISSINYTGNWLYVCLSRCTTLSGLFLRKSLNYAKCKGMSEECRSFLARWRVVKAMPEKYVPGSEDWIS